MEPDPDLETLPPEDEQIEPPPPAPSKKRNWTAAGFVVVTVLLVLVLVQLRQVRQEQQVQACYARTIGYTVMLGFPEEKHPEADALARLQFKSCRHSSEWRSRIVSREWGKNPTDEE